MHDSGAVIFTLDVERLATFYARLLGAKEIERSETHVAIGRSELRLTLHAIAPAHRKDVTVTTPPELREQSAVKLAFRVASIEEARVVAAELGGAINDAKREFSTDDRTLCDGHDPDGNVIQVWQAR